MPNLPPESVSVVVPVYNAGRYLAEALDSALGQTAPPHELIVIDDGSTDDSRAVLETYADRIRLYARENRGVAATLNEALDRATGAYVAFLDADDVWEAGKLARQLRCFRENPALEACFGHVRQFVSPELPPEVRAGIHCPAEAQPGWLKLTMLIRRETFEKTGRFDPTYHTGDFIEWFIRAKEAGLRHVMLPDVLAHRRLHRSGLASQRAFQREFAHLLKAALDRRRPRS